MSTMHEQELKYGRIGKTGSYPRSSVPYYEGRFNGILKKSAYTVYIHHDNAVITFKKTKGRHRDWCLCYYCRHCCFEVGQNCQISDDLLSLARKHGIAAPVWECPKFEPMTEPNSCLNDQEKKRCWRISLLTYLSWVVLGWTALGVIGHSFSAAAIPWISLFPGLLAITGVVKLIDPEGGFLNVEKTLQNYLIRFKEREFEALRSMQDGLKHEARQASHKTWDFKEE